MHTNSKIEMQPCKLATIHATLINTSQRRHLPKYLLTAPSASVTVNIPGCRTPKVGTWFAKIPIVPDPVGTSTCLTISLDS